MTLRTWAAALLGMGLLNFSADAADRIVVLELFTSQGCSSCPPADRLLQATARDAGILALSRPITYWDKLGWKDTLARPENTRKQKAYAWAMGGQRIYTPQLVVDGRAEGIGSNAATVRRLIDEARTRPVEAKVSPERLERGSWRIAVSGAAGAAIVLVSYLPEARVTITAGENDGEEIAYTNAVRSETTLGVAAEEPAVFETGPLSDGVKWAVIAQDGEAGPIRGAALLIE